MKHMMDEVQKIYPKAPRIKGAHPNDRRVRNTEQQQEGERPAQGVCWDISRKQVAGGRYPPQLV